MQYVVYLLTPVIFVLQWLLDYLQAIVGSWGVAIILLSIVVRVASIPVMRLTRKAEAREQYKLKQMAPMVRETKERFAGRERFERLDLIYKEHGYHPIQAMASLLPLLLQLPILIAVLLLLTEHPKIQGVQFLVVRDLGKPDALLQIGSTIHINLLPLLLTAIAIVEAFVRLGSTFGSRVKFTVVSSVIAALIYLLPSAVCIYWLTSNTWSLVAELIRNREFYGKLPPVPGR